MQAARTRRAAPGEVWSGDLHLAALVVAASAGHGGMVGSAIVRRLAALGYGRIVTRSRAELNLLRQADVEAFFEAVRQSVPSNLGLVF